MNLDSKVTAQQHLQNPLLTDKPSFFARNFAAPFELFDPLFFSPQPNGKTKFGYFVPFINEKGFLEFWRSNTKIFKSSSQKTLDFTLNDIYEKILSIENPAIDSKFWKSFIGDLMSGGLCGHLILWTIWTMEPAEIRSIFAKVTKRSGEGQLNETSDYIKKACSCDFTSLKFRTQK